MPLKIAAIIAFIANYLSILMVYAVISVNSHTERSDIFSDILPTESDRTMAFLDGHGGMLVTVFVTPA